MNEVLEARAEELFYFLREALACGRPVIASASGGLGELLGTPGLTLVAPEDADALAQAIELALRTGRPVGGCG